MQGCGADLGKVALEERPDKAGDLGVDAVEEVFGRDRRALVDQPSLGREGQPDVEVVNPLQPVPRSAWIVFLPCTHRTAPTVDIPGHA